MPIQEVPLGRWLEVLRDEQARGPWAEPGTRDLVLVDLDEHDGSVPSVLTEALPVVVVGRTAREWPELHPAAAACDVVLRTGDPALEAITATVAANPIASASFATLLRGAEPRSVGAGLLAESAVYSALQAGPEFAAWRASRPVRTRVEEGPPVQVERTGDELHITLSRPAVHNALDRAMRDALVEAFALVHADPSISRAHLAGEGPSFCAGGDLDEFGSFPDPATAHLVRLRQSVGRSIAAVAARVTAHVHGACFGSGIELPAFAGTVTADRSATMALPEVGLGLIPGAGGTVSLPARIGRHRTARLGLTGERIDAATALAWGLIDNVDDAPAPAQAVS
jgi:enoyl-CoA hydratase/carnithine racemase